MKTISFRKGCLLGFVSCAGLLAYALYAQFHIGLLPCPLCIFQRIAYAAAGLAFLVGAIHGPKGRLGRWIYGGLALVSSLTGAAIAARHVWLTHMPADEVPACGPPLSFMMETNPLMEVLKKVLTGSGSCAEVDWTFLGASMPAWSLAWFLILAGLSVFLLLKKS